MSSDRKPPAAEETPDPAPAHRPGGRLLASVWRVRSNILIAVLCTSLITMLDVFYGHLVNENYAFRGSALLKPGYWITFALIFIVTFSGRVFFSAALLVIFVLSIFQIMNFEYFGSYILPIHFIQLLPDFLLILAALVEAIGEMAPILAAGGLILLLALAAIVPLSRTRVIHPRAALLILMLLGGDLVGNYLFITINKEKLGEPSFKALFPDIPTKSGLMVGLGETDEEILDVMRDMRAHDIDMLTIGQYLAPSTSHLTVKRYVHPDTFKMFEAKAYEMGFRHAAVGAMVRSSYHADQQAGHAMGQPKA